MILKIHKCSHVPGNAALNCMLGPQEGWAGELVEDRVLKAYKRVPDWKFFHPYNKDDTIEDADEDCCVNWSAVPYKPSFVIFENDWVYRFNTFQAFVPFQ